MSTSSKLRLGYLPVQRSRWHNWLRNHQARSWWYLSFVNVNKHRDWDLAICWFRGRTDVTDWDATKLKVGWWYLSFVNVNKHRDLSFVNVNRLKVETCKCQQAQNWELVVYWFRGRNDITDWDATKLKVGWWYLSFVNVNKHRDLSFVNVNRLKVETCLL